MHGIDWTDGFAPCEEADALRFLKELRRETGEENVNHPLHKKNCEVLGYDKNQKDLILFIPEMLQYAWVHLTWNVESDPRWPWCRFLTSVEAVNRFIRREG